MNSPERWLETTLEQLGEDECLVLLRGATLGRLAFVFDGRPEIVPLSFRYADGVIVARTAAGTRLDRAVRATGAEVAFEVDDHDPQTATGWSVVVHGRAESVWRSEERRTIRELPLRPWAPGPREQYLRIVPTLVSGRRLRRG